MMVQDEMIDCDECKTGWALQTERALRTKFHTRPRQSSRCPFPGYICVVTGERWQRVQRVCTSETTATVMSLVTLEQQKEGATTNMEAVNIPCVCVCVCVCG